VSGGRKLPSIDAISDSKFRGSVFLLRRLLGVKTTDKKQAKVSYRRSLYLSANYC
jgi:hypothetical protein